MASTYLTKTYTTQPTNSRIGTFSFWIKFSKLSASGDRYLFSTYEDSNDRTLCKFNTDGKFELQTTEGANAGLRYDTNRVFRDTGAWYNIIIATDTTQNTAADRVKIYVNGVQETSFQTANNPAQNLVPHFLYGGIQKWIGVYGGGGANNWDGLMSHVAHIDGTQELPTIFGETDSTTGEWKIKTNIVPSSAWGTNGYWILKDGNTVTDSSSNSNTWTVGGGTLTKTEDNPSNVFATWNPLLIYVSEIPTFSEGNTKVSPTGNSSRNYAISTIAMPRTGKWYSEFKKLQNDNVMHIGILDTEIATARFQANAYVKDNAGGIVYDSRNGTITGNNAIQQSGLASSGNGDIIGLAIDMDSSLFYVYKNGTLLNTSGTGVNFSSFITGSDVAFFVGDGSSSGYDSCQANFGNGYFGTTAVSSAGTNASGNGIFEYDVPSGYTALSTKGLNT